MLPKLIGFASAILGRLAALFNRQPSLLGAGAVMGKYAPPILSGKIPVNGIPGKKYEKEERKRVKMLNKKEERGRKEKIKVKRDKIENEQKGQKAV